MSFFSHDAPIMRVLGSVYDLMVLNLIYAVTCLPVFTIGPAAAALYAVTFRIGTEREEDVWKCYFRSFRENFRQGVCLGGILLPLGLLTGFNILFCFAQTGPLRFFGYLFAALGILLAMVWSYAFPLLSQFSNTVRGTLRNALLMAVGYLPRTLAVTAMNFLPLFLLFWQPQVFFRVGYLWVVLYYAAAAYGNALLLRKVFAPYMQEAA